mgnify:CR=1 FL=1
MNLYTEAQAQRGDLTSRDTVRVAARTVAVFDTVYAAPPVLFFEKNSTMPVVENDPGNRYQRRILRGIQSLMEADPSAKLKIIGTTSPDEAADLSRERITWAAGQLNVDRSRIEVERRQGEEAPHEDLYVEMRRLDFEIDGKRVVIPVEMSKSTFSVDPITIIALHEVSCSPGPCTSVVEAYAGNSKLQVADNSGVMKLNVPRKVSSAHSVFPVSVRIDMSDTSGLKASAFDEVFVFVDDKDTVVSKTRVEMNGDVNSSMNVLGYFDFDKTSFSAVDEMVVARVLDGVRAGKRVRIIPSTDYFGEPGYNTALRERRAQAAIKLLALPQRSVEIDLTSQENTRETSPMQRVAQRCVRVQIID